MGEWSPECQRVEWTNGSKEAREGATFIGHNHTGPRGLIKWSRRGRVLKADRGREFAFATEEGGREGVVWSYRFEPVEDGTRVTESYEVLHIPVWAARIAAGEVATRWMTEGRGSSSAKLRAALAWRPTWATWRAGFRGLVQSPASHGASPRRAA